MKHLIVFICLKREEINEKQYIKTLKGKKKKHALKEGYIILPR